MIFPPPRQRLKYRFDIIFFLPTTKSILFQIKNQHYENKN